MMRILPQILVQKWLLEILKSRSLVLIIAAIWNTGDSVAQFEQPYLKYIEPVCLQKGATNSVTFHGDHLGGIVDAVIFRKGLSIRKLDDGGIGLHTPSDASEGLYQISPRGALGFSNPRSLLVSVYGATLLKNLKFTETNGIRLYERIEPENWIDGHYENGKVYRFPLSLKAGQNYTFLCLTSAIGSRMRPVIAVRDKEYRLLRRTNNSGLLTFSNPESNSSNHLILELRDQTYDGGQEYRFCFIAIPDGNPLQPWLRLASAQRSPHLAYSLTLPEPLRTVSEISEDIPKLTTKNNLNINEDAYDWDNVQEIEIDSSPLVAIPPNTELVSDNFFFRFISPKDGRYFIETIAHRVGGASLVQIELYDIENDGVKPSVVGKPFGGAPNFGRIHTAHYDSSVSTALKKGRPYGVKISMDPKFQSQTYGSEIYIRLFHESENQSGVILVPEYPPNKDPNSRNLFSQNLNFVRGQKLWAKVIAMRHQGEKKKISVDFKNLPNGLKANPEILEFNENESEKLISIASSIDSKNWSGLLDVRVSLINKNGEVTNGFFYSSNGPVWNIGDYNNEYSEFIVQPGAVANIDENLAAPIQLKMSSERPTRLKENEKVKIEFEVIRSSDIKDSELTLKDFSKKTKLPDIKFQPGQTKASMSLDLGQLKWKAGKYRPNFAIQLKHSMTDRGNKDKSKKKEYTFFALDDPWTITVEK